MSGKNHNVKLNKIPPATILDIKNNFDTKIVDVKKALDRKVMSNSIVKSVSFLTLAKIFDIREN